jgi:hypothetical protein
MSIYHKSMHHVPDTMSRHTFDLGFKVREVDMSTWRGPDEMELDTYDNSMRHFISAESRGDKGYGSAFLHETTSLECH